MNEPGDLTQIDIVLTDFGLVGQNSKGGTPIFASPECYEIKTNASDVFALGRVFLFMTLPKETFLKVLFVSIASAEDRIYLANTVLNKKDLVGLIYAMMKTEKSIRINDQQVRKWFDHLKRNYQIQLNSFAITEIERIATQNLLPEMINYIQDLDHIS